MAVTGIGMVTPLGISTSECWANMVAGKSGIDWIRRFDVDGCLTRIGGQIPDRYFAEEAVVFQGSDLLDRVLPIRLSLYTAQQAMNDSHLEVAGIDREKAGVITGCGGSTFGDEMMLTAPGHQHEHCHEMINELAATVSREYGFRGPAFNVATACASGAFAICGGYDFIRRGGAVCIAIGIDTILLRSTIEGFNSLMALTEENEFPQRASKPFDRKRSGFVLSEGACAVVLEPYSAAKARGARIHALVSGYGCTSEAFNIIAPEPEGKQMARTMELAVSHAGLTPDAIGYISAHGTSTPHNDLAETRAIKLAFGDHARRLAVSSQKSMIGHSIGAAGAIEFGVTALSLYHQLLTPTINYQTPDPDCDLDYVPNEARGVSALRAAITNSFGFGGHNASIVLEAANNLP